MMAVVRTSIVKDPAARGAYVDRVNGLKAELVTTAQGHQVTTTDLGIPGADPAVGPRPLSTYDLFVLWHYRNLNHCNVDRIWAAWQAMPGNGPYVPADDEPGVLFRHRPSNPLCHRPSNAPPRALRGW